MEGAAAGAAETSRDADAPWKGTAAPVTAESFRLLTSMLRREVRDQARARVPAPAPARQDAVILTMPVAAPRPVPLPEPVPEPVVEAAVEEPPPRVKRDPGEEAGETAITLLELMSTATGQLPQERALIADALLLLLPRLPLRQLVRVSQRIAIMENPPPLLVAKLIRDPRPEVMGPVLERSAQICDDDLMDAARADEPGRLRMIARRRVVSPVLSGHIIATGDTGAILALLRNEGARLPRPAFARLAEFAPAHPALLAPLATRADLPVATAFELYWNLPPELRRLMLSRFLTDSGALGRILRIALSEDGGLPGGALRDAKQVAPEALDPVLAALSSGQMDEASAGFAGIAGITDATARRILLDQHGEPLVVLLKALGLARVQYIAVMEKLNAGSNTEELQAVFDALSTTKARVLLTYWDWFTRKAAPYAGVD